MEKNNFYPEGFTDLQNPYSLDMLLYNAGRDTIHHATVQSCDPQHNLIINLGKNITGIIEKNEAAIGVKERKTRDIAIISRVGKPVCFTIEDIFFENGKTYARLSGRRAQLLAFENFKNNFCAGDVIPARVTHIESFGIFVDIGCGFTSFIGVEDLSVSRISTPSERFYVGQNIFAVITHIAVEECKIYLSHRELLGTWSQNAALFSAGSTVSGIVRGVESYGIFVELSPNLSGLAEPKSNLSAGDCVSVYIKAIVPEKMKVKLSIIDKLDIKVTPLSANDYFITSGHVSQWNYSPENCSRKVISSYFS